MGEHAVVTAGGYDEFCGAFAGESPERGWRLGPRLPVYRRLRRLSRAIERRPAAPTEECASSVGARLARDER
ncbi:hypothetical protein EMIT048CA2_70226 [Pseudomonas chlororaphis]